MGCLATAGWNTNEPLARPGARILDEQQVQAARCASHDEFDADFEMLPNHVCPYKLMCG